MASRRAVPRRPSLRRTLDLVPVDPIRGLDRNSAHGVASGSRSPRMGLVDPGRDLVARDLASDSATGTTMGPASPRGRVDPIGVSSSRRGENESRARRDRVASDRADLSEICSVSLARRPTTLRDLERGSGWTDRVRGVHVLSRRCRSAARRLGREGSRRIVASAPLGSDSPRPICFR